MVETLTLWEPNGADASQTNVKGQKIVTDVDGIIVDAGIDNLNDDGTVFEIRASNATTVLATASVAGGVATWNYSTAAGTYYIVHNATSQKQAYKNSGVSYPLTGTDINSTAGYSSSDGGDQATVGWNFNYVRFTAAVNATVTPSALALTLAQPASVAGVSMTVTPSALALTMALNDTIQTGNVYDGTTTSDAAIIGDKELLHKWPVEEGRIAGSTKRVTSGRLTPTDTFVDKRNRHGS